MTLSINPTTSIHGTISEERVNFDGNAENIQQVVNNHQPSTTNDQLAVSNVQSSISANTCSW